MMLFQKKANETVEKTDDSVDIDLSADEELKTPSEKEKKAGKTKKLQQKGAVKMPWRLIKLVVILLFAIVFAAFNIDNRCGVSLVFVNFQNVPVFVTMFVSFCIGIIFVLPFTIGRDSAVKKAQEAEAEVEALKAQKAMWIRQKKMPKNKKEKKFFFRRSTKKSNDVPEKTDSDEKESQNGNVSKG